MSYVSEERQANVASVAQNLKGNKKWSWYTEAIREETDSQEDSGRDRLPRTREKFVQRQTKGTRGRKKEKRFKLQWGEMEEGSFHHTSLPWFP